MKPYTKDELLFYWGAVHSVTQSLKHPNDNAWAEANADSFKAYHIGFDEVCVFYLKDQVIIAINGSDKDSDEWKSNLSAYPIVDKMHDSFRAHGTMIMNHVLHNARIGNKRVVVVGHSRGGPLAMTFCHYSKIKNIECITYGSPRLFTLSAKPKFKHHRVHTNGDVV